MTNRAFAGTLKTLFDEYSQYCDVSISSKTINNILFVKPASIDDYSDDETKALLYLCEAFNYQENISAEQQNRLIDLGNKINTDIDVKYLSNRATEKVWGGYV